MSLRADGVNLQERGKKLDAMSPVFLIEATAYTCLLGLAHRNALIGFHERVRGMCSALPRGGQPP